MKTRFTSEAISKGGRSGTVKSPDGLLDITLGNPLEAGIETRGPNPELLFAAAYSACYHGAVVNAAEKLGTPIHDSTVRAKVSLIEDDKGGYGLTVELHALLEGIEPDQAVRIMEAAHQTCPYSKALRGEASVTLVVDSNLLFPPPAQEKNLGRDLEVIEELPTEIQELSALMDESEKTTGKERAAVTTSILDGSE
ncbi:MAG: Ohr family peroxiredoxin [Gloeobacteraceae cyanobacterium ES-bin-144]|nr:Ohr family peroxiredoxin [Verrucomicrobiales bacterium]